MVPSTVDPDAAGPTDRSNRGPKRPVKISAWKLAKLDSSEAMRAASRARASSSVLRPLDNRRAVDPECSSSGNMSVASSVSTDARGNKEMKNELRLSPLRNSFAASQGSQDEYETGTQTASSFSSPSRIHESVTISPLPQAHAGGRFSADALVPGIPNRSLVSKTAFPGVGNHGAHSTAEVDENIIQKGNTTDPLLLTAPTASILRDVKRTSVVWDQEAGRYVSVPVSAAEVRTIPRQKGLSSSSADPSTLSNLPPQESSMTAKPPEPQADKLMYTGDSIFFGGPLLSVPDRNNLRNERGLGPREGQDRSILKLPRESRFKRDSVSNQLPVFIPGGLENLASGSGFK